MLVKRMKPHSILESATLNSIFKRNSSFSVLRGRRLEPPTAAARIRQAEGDSRSLARCGWGLTVLTVGLSCPLGFRCQSDAGENEGGL